MTYEHECKLGIGNFTLKSSNAVGNAVGRGGIYLCTMFFQIELPRDSMIVGRNRGHVTSRAKRVKYKAEVEAILSLSRGVIHLKEHS